MNAVDTSERYIGKSESNEIGQLLERITAPALLLTEDRQTVYVNYSARAYFQNIEPAISNDLLLPEISIWNRIWNRIKQGHTVSTSTFFDRDVKFGTYSHRVNFTLSLLSGNDQKYAMCVLSEANTCPVDAAAGNFGEFPEENPNPVMRVSDEGRVLYANRASDPLLNHWNKVLREGNDDDGLKAFNRAVESGSTDRIDINCGDRVFSFAFAPVQGNNYINVYALDTTDKKQTEQALKSALKEVHNLKNRLQEENDYLQEEIKQTLDADEIIGESEVLQKLLQQVNQVARTDATVLILGETGTGKELLARAIHANSQRKTRPLVKVNCAALPASLIESELFGHEKGAFTGAISRKTGRFEIADGGTIFLDEIGDLPLELQSKLLRVLQEGDIERVGSNQTIRVDVRVIAATNRNLTESLNAGEFREDLFYRLNVFPIISPPLRDRSDDIPVIAHRFLTKYSSKIGKHVDSIDPSVIAKLQNYDWPGNVRELENVIERGVILTEGRFLQLDEGFHLARMRTRGNGGKTLKEVEQEMIVVALEDAKWKIEGKNGAANRLGMPPSTLRERIKKYGINRPESESVTGFYTG